MEIPGAVKLLSKVIQVGLALHEAWTNEGIDTKELATLPALTDLLGEFEGKSGGRSAELEALHFAVITHCFGRAFGRHWAFNPSLAPTHSKRLRLFMSRAEKERAEEIELRLDFAVRSLAELGRPGDLPAGTREWKQVESLTGSPLSTPYYRALWHAFTHPNLNEPEDGGPPLIDMGESGRLEFERHFLIAYHHALSSSAGQPLQVYQQRLSGDYLGRLLRELLLKDMANWGERHIFGSVERRDWSADAGIPFMPLGEMYVEPDARCMQAQKEPHEPVTGLIERLLKEPMNHILVIKADFGMGKSLTGRTLAQRWAHRFLTERLPSSQLILPVFIRCAEDLPGDDFQLEQTVRRAWQRQARALGLDLKTRDPALMPPEKDQRTVFLIDGLDEVILNERRLSAFFERIREEATNHHRFIVLSRPGALPSTQELKNIPVVKILPWREELSERWLGKWRHLHEGKGPAFQDLKDRRLSELAGTPILLFMIAQTWGQLSQASSLSLSALYEEFFWQIAKGKHDAAQEHHRNIQESSAKLREHLIDRGLLDLAAGAPEAMLWLMGRVAWEATKREQRGKFFSTEIEELTEREIENLIVDELGIRGASDTLHAIQVGLLLSMQAHLSGGKASRLLFGHKSFREYLVARYWADRLKALARARERDWKNLEESLLDGRLLSREDRTFEFLMEMLNGEPLPQHPHSPFGLDKREREGLLDWAQNRFESEEQEFLPRRSNTLREDRRPWLREAALAIGSSLHGTPGMEVRNALTVRSMLAWFWLTRLGPILIAPKARWRGSVLSELKLRGANFRGADLESVNFSNTEFLPSLLNVLCDFTDARLDGAILKRAQCSNALFQRASLK